MGRIAATLLVALSVLAAAIGVSACGGDGDSTASTSTQESNGQGAPRETGEQSVEKFGAEAGGSDRQQILAAEQAYLSALGDEDFATACAYLASQTQASVRQFVAPQLKAKGCAGILSKVLAPSAFAIARQQANGEITKVRIEADQAFVIFRAPGAKLYVFTMVEEDGEWKATTVTPSILVPDPATFE